ncbi:CvpA family protein [Camelliibacillus cellulosilyticus]|uniref:CvpA family protein n=1 Tax=Camelliibacillus cellulosilyticus TaxID=2174486 RepID=A0ABV9GMN8_9BACL
MLDFILIILLLAGFLIGARRGLILQLIHLTGFIVAYIVAYMYFDDLAPKLKLWIPYPSSGDSNSFFTLLGHLNLESSFYRAIAFVIIFIAVKIVWQIIGSMLDFLTDLPILRTVNRWLGALFGFVEIYLVLFILLYIGALTPYLGIDKAIDHSYVAHVMIENTPVLSEKIRNLWLEWSSGRLP